MKERQRRKIEENIKQNEDHVNKMDLHELWKFKKNIVIEAPNETCGIKWN